MKNQKQRVPTSPLKGDFILIDIETSGLRPDKDRIVEIDLVVIKKGVIQTKWHSAINPKEKRNPSTKTPPLFADIAVKLHKLLKNKMMMAHNANFVYGFLKAEMLRCDIILEEKTLCSISLSRFLFPESKQHHLKAINARLSLDVKEEKPLPLLLNFFNKLDEIITPEDLQNKMKELTQSSQSVLNVDHKGSIPPTPGIYQCYDKNNVVIYVGKSTSLCESVSSHFQLNQNAHKELPIAKQIKKIDWVKTYGELGTFLLATKYIKNHKPLFNRLVEKNKNLYTIQLTNNGEYLALKVVSLSDLLSQDFPTTLGIFKNEKDAINLLRFFINESNLCHQVNTLGKPKKNCFRFKINKCNGACNKLESPEEYNARVQKIINTFAKNTWPFKNKIAIKETCGITNDSHFHIIHNWVYIETLKSLEKVSSLGSSNTEMDVSIYNYLNKFLNKEENYQYVIEIA